MNFKTVYNFISVIVSPILAYFSPIKGIVHVVIIFFLIDVWYGYRASVKVGKKVEKKIAFEPVLVWKKTMPRLGLSLILLVLAFMLDTETGQTLINTSNIIGYVICFLVFWSILQNGYIVTNWEVIPLIGEAIQKKAEKRLDIKLERKIVNGEIPLTNINTDVSD